MSKSEVLLDVKNLSLDLKTNGTRLPVLQNLNFQLFKGEFLSLVGESGCGKSLTALSLTKLLPKQLADYKSGEVVFGNRDLLKLDGKELQNVRGLEIAYIFQEPFSALNPLHKIKDQIIEGYLVHGLGSKKMAIEKAEYLLSRVGITDIKERMNSYPNQMSGGMLQRICIAMALVCDPKLLIADEPTSAIDVTIQAQLIELLFDMKKEFNLSALFISHDIAMVGRIADRIAVMYAGQIAEIGSVDTVIDHPSHPYTKALLNAYPSIKKDSDKLTPIPGIVPSPDNYPIGCHFSDRCGEVMDKCKLTKPKLFDLEKQSNIESSKVACFLYGGDNA
ncbi:ABC transporter ATP-binding protein [Leptospira sp. GIMC2001]|uniref:ABC transporter ATP-binding protein n=1 Tax=Leptospira sp. GIMC2001 TaxID=1513297 RepID=UPI00234BB9B5|nr:ABC transporter ATP-binding protein [Leptospira sp. GIMC2001]WCL48540.1 ABC transporter ATP-binding protein [Leptospira sp. GIMC2001]